MVKQSVNEIPESDLLEVFCTEFLFQELHEMFSSRAVLQQFLYGKTPTIDLTLRYVFSFKQITQQAHHLAIISYEQLIIKVSLITAILH